MIVLHSYSPRPRAHNSELPGRLSPLVDWYLLHACCFTSHIDTYWHYVLSTVSIMYVYVLFFMLYLRFASYLINEYVMLFYAIHHRGHLPLLLDFKLSLNLNSDRHSTLIILAWISNRGRHPKS